MNVETVYGNLSNLHNENNADIIPIITNTIPQYCSDVINCVPKIINPKPAVIRICTIASCLSLLMYPDLIFHLQILNRVKDYDAERFKMLLYNKDPNIEFQYLISRQGIVP